MAGIRDSPLEHGVRADGPVLQRAEGRQLHHEHIPALSAQIEELAGGVRQDHGDLCGTGGSPEDRTAAGEPAATLAGEAPAQAMARESRPVRSFNGVL